METTTTTKAETTRAVILASGEKALVSEAMNGQSALITLHTDNTSRAGKLALCARKDALVKALTAAGLRCKKADGLRYTGSQFSSMNTGLRYEFRVLFF